MLTRGYSVLYDVEARAQVAASLVYNAAVPLLVADDDGSIRSLFRAVLTRAGHAVVAVDDGAAAIAELRKSDFDVVITDLIMPNADGFEVLRRSRELRPRTPVIMLTGEGSIRDCVEAMRAGAFNFLSKPIQPHDLKDVVERALRTRAAYSGAGAALALENEGRPQVALIGSSPLLRKVLDVVERVARTDGTVLITGESGTGKEVVARLVHSSSPRAAGPFVAINCGAIPEALIESELFGHAKGSFTGATESRTGKFMQAHGGTLFLDEVGDLPLGMQVKLLRVLQEREVTPVGDNTARKVDVRIIAATNLDLEAAIHQGKFRQDLYYRLEVLPIQLPPLRDRVDDIPLLVRHFLDTANRRLATSVEMAEDAMALLRLYPWPGNVREMENLIERLVILARSSTITAGDLPARICRDQTSSAIVAVAAELARGPIDLTATLAAIEATLIEQALLQAKGNRTHAAESLGISRTTLVDKLKRREA
ncbi:MAG: Two component, sigma54 specific, transcriptional regulator, Fis family [Myxococcales bacterium]|nr:Two component, sigma54 specific, transcriptional regulator, Fis family [Myxococcales bacterium]